MKVDANRDRGLAGSRIPAGVLLLVLAAALRAYRLGSQLWLDEISALTESIGRPLSKILSEWPGVSSHVLYEVLARLSGVALGFGPIGLRLPAALFGVAGVWMIYRLAQGLGGRVYGLFVGALFAVSYHHVFYSQNARGYTALMFLALASFVLFLRFNRTGRCSRTDAWLYAGTNALLAYVQPFGVFVPASNFLVAVGLAWRARRQTGDPSFPFRPFAAATIGAGAITALLYTPFVPGLLAHARTNVASEAEGPRLGMGLANEVIEGLSAAFGGPLGLALVVLLGATGFVLWVRDRPLAAAVLCLPPVLEAATFAAAGFGLHPRYFAVALPVIFLVAGHVIYRIVDAAARAVAPRRAGAVSAVALVVVVLLSAVPLIGYYRVPKQDFRSAYELIESRAANRDARLGIQSAGTALGAYYDPAYVKIESVEDLARLESRTGTTWVVMTLNRITETAQPELHRQVLDRYEHVQSFAGSVGDGAVTVYRRSATP